MSHLSEEKYPAAIDMIVKGGIINLHNFSDFTQNGLVQYLIDTDQIDLLNKILSKYNVPANELTPEDGYAYYKLFKEL